MIKFDFPGVEEAGNKGLCGRPWVTRFISFKLFHVDRTNITIMNPSMRWTICIFITLTYLFD